MGSADFQRRSFIWHDGCCGGVLDRGKGIKETAQNTSPSVFSHCTKHPYLCTHLPHLFLNFGGGLGGLPSVQSYMAVYFWVEKVAFTFKYACDWIFKQTVRSYFLQLIQ